MSLNSLLIFSLAVFISGCVSQIGGNLGSSASSPVNKEIDADARKSFADIPVSRSDAIDISRSLLFNSGETWLGQAVIKSSQSAEAAFDYYINEMPTYGWTLVTSVQSKVSVLNYEKGTRFASVQIDEAEITVTVSYRDMAEN
tara:strand:+ start:999 stop:1427 length:429 start_codon:yes stop_codon:yes gene_type:complete